MIKVRTTSPELNFLLHFFIRQFGFAACYSFLLEAESPPSSNKIDILVVMFVVLFATDFAIIFFLGFRTEQQPNIRKYWVLGAISDLLSVCLIYFAVTVVNRGLVLPYMLFQLILAIVGIWRIFSARNKNNIRPWQ